MAPHGVTPLGLRSLLPSYSVLPICVHSGAYVRMPSGMSDAPPNLLYYGDNLDILRRYVEDDSVDLVYLDPPFNSNADYNVLFAEKSGEKGHTQISQVGRTKGRAAQRGEVHIPSATVVTVYRPARHEV